MQIPIHRRTDQKRTKRSGTLLWCCATALRTNDRYPKPFTKNEIEILFRETEPSRPNRALGVKDIM